MASAADIGANFDNYQGNPIAGGETAGVFKIDNSPIQQMAQYTVMYNKAKWEQTQADAQNKINQLAEVSTLNPNNAVPKDKPEALAAVSELREKATKFASTIYKNDDEKTKAWIDWLAAKGDAVNKINSINKRAIGYQARKVDIQGNSTYDATQKQLRLSELDKEANSTDIFTPISPVDGKFDLTVPKIGDPVYAKIDVLKTDATGNGNMTNNHTLFDPKANMSASYLVSQGLSDLQNRKPANDLDRQELDLQKASSNDQMVWNDASQFLNTAINDPKYKDDKGVTDFNKIESDNPLVANIVGLASRWNDYSAKMKEDIASGVFTDINGKVLRDAKDYFTIDPKSGISASQMVFLEKFAKANPDALDTKYTHTGDANNAGRLAIESKKADADIVYKHAMAGAAQTKAKAYVDNVKHQMSLRKTDAEKDKFAEDLFVHNIVTQQNLTKGLGNNKFALGIDADKSLPIFTFEGGAVKQLKPIGATAIGVDGKPIDENSTNAKVAYYKGGHFDTQYSLNGKAYTTAGLSDLYVNFKKEKERRGEPFQGDINDFIKKWVKDGVFDVKVIGENGSSDKQIMTAAQRAISNKATSKGEQGVFDAPVDTIIPDSNSITDNLDQ